MKEITLLLLLLETFVYTYGSENRIDPLVSIAQGLIKGQRAKNGDYTTFLGIPYAKVNKNNPFGPALPPETFGNEKYFANDGNTKCPQQGLGPRTDDETETLDCLKLNIYVPNEASSDNPLPILVWIHGGGFSGGTGGHYRPEKLVSKGIIVITVNYRLGPYGFMCLDHPTVPGNQGLKDQYAALRWVRSNIQAFGGNPHNVTLAGQSAGACSVMLQLFSPKEKLFHKLIVQSGTPQSYGMFVNRDETVAIKLANYLGLQTTSTNQALKYLSQTSHNLVTAAATALKLTLRPCKEKSFSGVDNFIESDPYALSNVKKINNTPILIGHTSREERVSVANPAEFDPGNFYNIISSNYNLDEDTLRKVSEIIKHYYIGDGEISEDAVLHFADFDSDLKFYNPTQRFITQFLRENAGPVYTYLFDYVGDNQEGAGHSAELKYLFNMSNPIDAENENENDSNYERVSEYMTTMWSNFVKHGDPTYSNIPVAWAPVSKETRPFLKIGKELQMGNRVFKERMAFWDLFHANYGHKNVLMSRAENKNLFMSIISEIISFLF